MYIRLNQNSSSQPKIKVMHKAGGGKSNQVGAIGTPTDISYSLYSTILVHARTFKDLSSGRKQEPIRDFKIV